MTEYQAPNRELTWTKIELTRRVWELPLAIVLWVYIALGVLTGLLLAFGVLTAAVL